MEELFKIAIEYYKKVGFPSAIKNRPVVFILFVASTILLIISIIIIFRYPIGPISFTDFIKSLGGLLYITSLLCTFITYWLLDQSKVKNLDDKRKIITSLLNCSQEELLEVFKKYDVIFELYKKYNQSPRVNVYYYLEKFFIWMFSTVIAVYVSLNFKSLESFLKWIDSKNFWFFILLLTIIVIYYSLFRDFIPYWIRQLVTIIDNERKVELFLRDLSLLVKVTTND